MTYGNKWLSCLTKKNKRYKIILIWCISKNDLNIESNIICINNQGGE